jgi:hypothetical protein
MASISRRRSRRPPSQSYFSRFSHEERAICGSDRNFNDRGPRLAEGRDRPRETPQEGHPWRSVAVTIPAAHGKTLTAYSTRPPMHRRIIELRPSQNSIAEPSATNRHCFQTRLATVTVTFGKRVVTAEDILEALDEAQFQVCQRRLQ